MSTRLLFADSDNRDATLYPEGSSYVLHLTRPIKNIERIDLVSARVPNTMYNLTQGSNVLVISGSNVSLNQGFYSVYTLAQAVTNSFAASGGSVANATVEYLPAEGHFIFSSVTQFTLKIQSSELASLLGLIHNRTYTGAIAPQTDPTYATKYIQKSTTLVDLSLNDYIFLDIDELRTPSHVDTGSLQGTTGTISGSNANRNFAPVILDVNSGCIKNFHENKDYRVSVEYPEPIASLQRLTVRWVDKSGALLNFRGWNANAFVLRIHIREDQERTLPPPPPLQDVEIKRIIEAMTIAMPPPAPKESKRKIPWWLILIVLIGAIVAYKSWPKPAAPVTPVPVGV
jgi:hypothetical protein